MADKPKGKDAPKDKPKGLQLKQQDLFIELAGFFLVMMVLSSLFSGFMSAVNDPSLFQRGWQGFTFKGLTLSNTRPLASVLNPIGGHVIVSEDSTDVLSDAGGKKIGTQSFGAKGKVLKGPVSVKGVNYYYVDFESGADGWVREESVAYVNTEVRPLRTTDPLGSTVLASADGTVLRDAPGGNIIGKENKNSRGTITRGPVSKDGINYYYVEFDDGSAGWVAQEDLLVDAPVEQSGIVKVLLFLWKIIFYIKYVLWLVLFVLIVLLVRFLRALTQVRTNVREKLFPTVAVASVKKSQNPKWDRIITYVESPNENDWRLAIIEADIMLSELLDTMHLNGDSIGEKLKGVEKSDFLSLDNAWEAHKVRNQIAHAGGDFRITQREALRVIDLYRTVFKEFQFV